MTLFPDYTIKVCHGGSCIKNFAPDIKKKLEAELQKKASTKVNVVECTCMTFCTQAANLAIINEKTQEVKIKNNINPGKIVGELADLF